MRSNRTYSVEVQAVSYWRQMQLKGPRAIVHFTTQRCMSCLCISVTTSRRRHSYEQNQVFFFLSLLLEVISPVPGNPTGDNLDVGTPFYQDGQLQVHVYWQSAMGMFVPIGVLLLFVGGELGSDQTEV